MKKILSIALMLIVVLSVLPMALADENNTTDDANDNETADQNTSDDTETANETEAMDTTHGAKMRLLQLEKAITRNILNGQEIVKEADNATELNAILAEMEALKLEVQKADPAAEDAVQIFVDLKKDAIDLSKQFRDKARALVKKEKQTALKERLKNEKEDLKDLTEKINSEIKAFNSERMLNMYIALGLNGDLIEKIKSRNMTAKEALDQMKETLKNMTPEQEKICSQS